MKLGDFIQINPKIKLTKKSPYPFVEMKDLKPFVRSVESQYLKDFSGSGSKFEFGDTLLARITPCLENGKTSQYRGAESPAWGSGEFIVLREIDGKTDNGFIYYLARSPEFRSHGIKNMIGTSGRQRVPNDSIENFECELPSLEDQKAIAHILGTLDDKIELNQKMNQTLEEIAKAIFKSWFVDFDPVRAKAKNRPTGLPPEISDLFPDELVDSEIGEIPKRWGVGELSEVMLLWKKSVNPSNSADVFEHYSFPAFDNGQNPAMDFGNDIKSNKTLVPEDSLLVSKLNPDTPRIWLPDQNSENTQICSTEFMVFQPSEISGLPFLWGLFSDRSFQRRLESMVMGTSKSHQRIRPPDVLRINTVIPTKILSKHFNEMTNPVLERIRVSRAESRVLSELRDTLLPKLISGKLRIPDAEKLLEEAGI